MWERFQCAQIDKPVLYYIDMVIFYLRSIEQKSSNLFSIPKGEGEDFGGTWLSDVNLIKPFFVTDDLDK